MHTRSEKLLKDEMEAANEIIKTDGVKELEVKELETIEQTGPKEGRCEECHSVSGTYPADSHEERRWIQCTSQGCQYTGKREIFYNNLGVPSK